MSHKVPEDGGADAGLCERIASITTSSSFHGRAKRSSAYVCVHARAETSATVDDVSLFSNYFANYRPRVMRCEIMRPVWVRREILRALTCFRVIAGNRNRKLSTINGH